MATGPKLVFPQLSATIFLRIKLWDFITQSNVPALAAVLVRDQGNTVISYQDGIRKMGESGPQNDITPHDRFPLGSVSKPFTGTLMGKLVEDGVFGWNGFATTLLDVFPELPNVSLEMYPEYKTTTMDQLLAHVSGMPYNACTEPSNQWLDPNNLTIQNLMERRLKFVYASVLDEPYHDCTGTYAGPYTYGGGTIICAAMAERKKQTVYEQLLKKYVYDPLGMQDSGWGVTSPGGLTGPWLHGWDNNSLTASPDQASQQEAFNYASHGPAGSLCCSAADLGKYLQEQLIANPKVCSADMRHQLQTQAVTNGPFTSAWVRGSWESSLPGSDTADLQKNGFWGVSYALVDVDLESRTAMGAISTINDRFSVPAITDIFDAMQTMDQEWNSLFEQSDVPAPIQSVHPMPAVTMSGNDITVYGRRRDGVFMHKGFSNGAWQAPGELPSGVFSSGIAACASGDGKTRYVAGRGLDNYIWYKRSSGRGGPEGFKRLEGGTFLSGAAIAGAGSIVHMFATGMDNKMYHTRSLDNGNSWSPWTAIGAGLFTSGPAAASSADGSIVHVFGRGNDYRIWHNTSLNGGVDWEPHWLPVGDDLFVSGPAAAASADGQTIYLCARGTDRCYRLNKSVNNQAWERAWLTTDSGIFTSAPAMSTDESGTRIYVCGLAGDFRLCAASSQDGGANWSNWLEVWDQIFI